MAQSSMPRGNFCTPRVKKRRPTVTTERARNVPQTASRLPGDDESDMILVSVKFSNIRSRLGKTASGRMSTY